MTGDNQQELCSDEQIEALAAMMNRDEEAALAELAGLLDTYPQDARLHFLLGSVLAGQGRFEEGRQSMLRAVEIAPDYHIARFQLGFLELTSGDAASAQQNWAPLAILPDEHFLRLFAEGLSHLIRDDFGATIALLERGMAANHSLPQMNIDMQLVIDAIRAPATPEPEGTSAAHLLLQRYSDQTRH